MRALPTPGPSRTPVEPTVDLQLVEAGRPERADHFQQRAAFRSRCEEIARRLARTEDFEDRMDLCRRGGFTAHELTIAAALRPDLMPTLNGEWEWIAVTLADNRP